MTDYKINPLTVDVIIEKDNSILMIRRKSDTFDGHLAFPGGFVDIGETVEHAAIREAKEELNVEVEPIAILGVYSGEERDPRGPTVSVAFICKYMGTPKAGDDASDFEWMKISERKREKLAFDHLQILEDYMDWKKSNSTYWTSK